MWNLTFDKQTSYLKSHFKMHLWVKFYLIYENRLILPWKPQNGEERLMTESNDGTTENMFTILQLGKVETFWTKFHLKKHFLVKYYLIYHNGAKERLLNERNDGTTENTFQVVVKVFTPCMEITLKSLLREIPLCLLSRAKREASIPHKIQRKDLWLKRMMEQQWLSVAQKSSKWREVRPHWNEWQTWKTFTAWYTSWSISYSKKTLLSLTTALLP